MEDYTSDTEANKNICRVINMACCLTLLPILFLRYRYAYLERFLQLNLISTGRYFETSDLLYFLGEALFCTLFAPPGVNVEYASAMLGGTYIFRLDSIVSIFQLLKTYHFIRLYVHYSAWLTGETY